MALTKSHSDKITKFGSWVEVRQPGPAWSTVGVMVGGLALVVAVTGLYWDVAFHVDHGRDQRNLFTAPHLLILAGLLGLGLAAVLSILLATASAAARVIRFGPLRVPYSALALLVMAAGAAAGFPLDDLWHRTYGIDVTMWGPTHLLMIGGAVGATFAINLLAAEGSAESGSSSPQWQQVARAGSVLIGLSILGLEFDFGVPQWQALYQPLLVAVTAGLGLCLARASIGRGGALLAAGFYLGLRLLLTLFVHSLGYTMPAFPLLAGSALCVEAAFLLQGRLAPALLAGALVGTAGLATEWLWTYFVYPLPWQGGLLTRAWLPAIAALAGAVVGTALGRVVSGRTAGVPAAAIAACVAVLAVSLAVPLPRDGVPLAATLEMSPVGPARATVDRDGLPSYEQDVALRVRLDHPEVVDGADWFTVLAWQGGGRRLVRLLPDGRGGWHSASPIPTGGSWKSVVYLASGPTMASVPVYFPPDPQYGSQGYSADPQVVRAFLPSPRLITSESHGGSPLVAVAAYLALVLVGCGWLVTLALAATRVAGAAREAPQPGGGEARR